MMKASLRGFTLIELLIVIGLVVLLAAMLWPAGRHVLDSADRVDSASHLQAVGAAILSYTADHVGTLPGPLWPGQVMEYDPTTNGRIVNILADYLSIHQQASPYLVEGMIPRAVRRALPQTDLTSIRIYLMNTGVALGFGAAAPFGLATTGVLPLKLSALSALQPADDWMAVEADQKIPYVSTAPWKNETPILPLHDGNRATLHFDGRVTFDKVTNS